MKKNKILRGFCAGLTTISLLCGSLAAMPVSAEEETFSDEVLTYTKIGDGVSITACEVTATAFDLPDNIDGYPILEIGDGAFAGCEKLSKLNLSKTKIRSIGENAFSGCTALKDFDFPEDTLKTIGKGAFYGCGSLTKLTIPDSVTEVGTSAFAYCFGLDTIELSDAMETLPSAIFYYDYALSDVKMPKNLKKIDAMCLMGCYALQSVSIPASVAEIDSQAFLEASGIAEFDVDANNAVFSRGVDGSLCTKDGSNLLVYPASNGVKECVVPDTVKEIAAYAFSGSIGLEQVTLPSSLTMEMLPDGCFSNCLSLKKVVCDDALLKQISTGLFAGCTSLESFTLPADCTAIGNYAFYGCGALNQFEIPESVKEIGEYAFCGCDGLATMTIPKTVDTIGQCAVGFALPATDESGTETQATVRADFVLRGNTPSAAKDYASQNSIQFKSTNFPLSTICLIIAAVCGVLTVIWIIRNTIKKKKEQAAEQTQEDEHPVDAEPEQYFDENYQSILAEDTDENKEDTEE